MNALLHDCRHAVRLYVRTPGASLIAVFVLAVSMAFVCAFLSLYVDLALKPHPGFSHGNRITSIGQSDGDFLQGVPYALIDRLADELPSIAAAASVRREVFTTPTNGELARTLLVTKGFFNGLEPRMALGRGFLPEEHLADAEPVIVLSHRFWQTRFAGDPEVLGSFLEIGRNPGATFQTGRLPFAPPSDSDPKPERESAQFRIVGIMADGLSEIPVYGGSYEPVAWLPIERVWPMFVGAPAILPGMRAEQTIALRAPGVSAPALANELHARYAFEQANPDWIPTRGFRPEALDGIVINVAAQREARRQLEFLLAGSVLLALVAAANLSLFLLARAPGRRRELGVRLAVGAPKRRLARQLATEAGLLVFVSTVAGLVGSVWLALVIGNLPSLREATWGDVTVLDWRVLVLVATLMLVLGLAVSLAPILGLKRVGISAASRSIAARASPAQRLAGTVQVTIAGVLVAAAIGFGWHLASLVFGDAGYELSNRFLVPNLGVGGAPDARIIARERQREAIEAIPGVSAVAYGYPIPGNEDTSLFPVRQPHPDDPSRVIEISRGGLEDRMAELLGYDLLYGRVPKADEANVVVVNQSAAQALWRRDDVVGERLYSSAESAGFEIVGVLKDLSFGHPLTAARPYAFETINRITFLHSVIETQLSAAELQQALARLSRDGVLDDREWAPRPLKSIRFTVTAPDRVRSSFTIAAALLVVFLSGLGFYATQRYLVASGRREYAIRASLGAGPRALGRLVMLRGIALGLPGLVLGGLLAFIVVAWLRGDYISSLVSPVGVAILVLAGLTALLLIASLGPAAEARRTRPSPLLRED